MRGFIGLVFFPLFIGWAAYRAFIKRDLKHHMNDFYGGLFFCGVWALIYYWAIS